MSNGLRGTSAFDAGTPLAAASPFGLGLSAIDETDDGFEIHFHLVAGGTGALAARFDFRALRHGGGNGVGQLTREPVYDVIHRTAPSRWAHFAVCPNCAKRLGPSAAADVTTILAVGGTSAQIVIRRANQFGKIAMILRITLGSCQGKNAISCAFSVTWADDRG